MKEVKEEIKEILISEIFIPPDYLRIYTDPKRINEIALSIEDFGQFTPIIVVPIEYVKDLEKEYPEAKKYKYILVDGLYRIKAIQLLLKEKYIKAIIRYNDYDEESLKSLARHASQHVKTKELLEENIKYYSYSLSRFGEVSKVFGDVLREFPIEKIKKVKFEKIVRIFIKIVEDTKDIPNIEKTKECFRNALKKLFEKEN
jgi:hypothetical protein